MGQKYSNEIIGKVHKIGNNLGLPGPALRNTLDGLEEDVKEETGVDVTLPARREGRRGAAHHAIADFFAEPHIDSLIGYAKVFHAAGISLDALLARLGSGELLAVHRQLRQTCRRSPSASARPRSTWA